MAANYEALSLYLRKEAEARRDSLMESAGQFFAKRAREAVQNGLSLSAQRSITAERFNSLTPAEMISVTNNDVMLAHQDDPHALNFITQVRNHTQPLTAVESFLRRGKKQRPIDILSDSWFRERIVEIMVQTLSQNSNETFYFVTADLQDRIQKVLGIGLRRDCRGELLHIYNLYKNEHPEVSLPAVQMINKLPEERVEPFNILDQISDSTLVALNNANVTNRRIIRNINANQADTLKRLKQANLTPLPTGKKISVRERLDAFTSFPDEAFAELLHAKIPLIGLSDLFLLGSKADIVRDRIKRVVESETPDINNS